MRATGRKVLCLVMFLCIFIACQQDPAFAVTISIQPPSSQVLPGETFSLAVFISGVTDLFAFQFDLGFDPALLSATSVDEGSFLPSGGLTFFIPGAIDNTLGTISFIADSLIGPLTGVTGSGVLAAVNFTALDVGTSPVTLSNVLFLDSGLADIPTSIQSGSVSVVPEPGTLLLLGSGLALAGLVGLRKKLR